MCHHLERHVSKKKQKPRRPSPAYKRLLERRDDPARKLERPFVERVYDNLDNVKEAAAQYLTIEGADKRRPYLIEHPCGRTSFTLSQGVPEVYEQVCKYELQIRVSAVDAFGKTDPRPSIRLRIDVLTVEIRQQEQLLATMDAQLTGDDDKSESKFLAFRDHVQKGLDAKRRDLKTWSDHYVKLADLQTEIAIREHAKLLALAKQTVLTSSTPSPASALIDGDKDGQDRIVPSVAGSGNQRSAD